MSYEVTQSVEARSPAGAPVEVTALGSFDDLDEAVGAARVARTLTMRARPDDYAWWTVKEPGAQLARWISDSRSAAEYVLDLRTGQLVEVGSS